MYVHVPASTQVNLVKVTPWRTSHVIARFAIISHVVSHLGRALRSSRQAMRRQIKAMCSSMLICGALWYHVLPSHPSYADILTYSLACQANATRNAAQYWCLLLNLNVNGVESKYSNLATSLLPVLSNLSGYYKYFVCSACLYCWFRTLYTRLHH
jgi:hypothetical protein